jgi:hypothetical protein
MNLKLFDEDFKTNFMIVFFDLIQIIGEAVHVVLNLDFDNSAFSEVKMNRHRSADQFCELIFSFIR